MHLGLEKRKKRLQLCFPISLNVLNFDGISVIYITVPYLHYYITIM